MSRSDDPSRSQTELAPATPRIPQGTVPIDERPALVAERYEIIGLLGSGAMGAVYRAKDLELDEMVALKVLKSELARSSGMLERFRREVKLARKVTHRNVARTFDIGEHRGERFLTMELIEGEMLGARIEREGRLVPKEAVPIAMDVASGLAAAHEAGVLHRDLKPENVILARDGRAVITDFGIARALTSPTSTATFVGTPGYMAPEQVEGLDLDARADLYALGAMLFELLTGRMPWTGESVIAIAAARLLHPPPDVRTVVAELPETLANVVLKLMARRREDRYANAAAARDALAGVGDITIGTVPPIALARSIAKATPTRHRGVEKVIAVLPLLALSGPEDVYLTQNITADIVDSLSVVPTLRIRPSGTTARFVSPDRDVREIGRLVSADAIVDGSLRRVGDRVRISVRLIAIADGFQLWARRFDRTAAEVLDVADEAARAIAEALATDRTGAATVPDSIPTDPIAQDLYLRARYELHNGWFDRTKGAINFLRDAQARAPHDTRIRALLGLGLARAYRMDILGPESEREAREIAADVLAKEPDNGMAHVILGALHFANGEAAAAALELSNALKHTPTNVDALDLLGRILVEIGRIDDGIRLLENACALEPSLDRARHDIARVHALRGDMDAFENTVGPRPQEPLELLPYLMLHARLALWNRDLDGATAVVKSLQDAGLRHKVILRVETFVDAIAKRKLLPEHRAMLDEMTHREPGASHRRACFMHQLQAEFLLVVNEVEGAMRSLRESEMHGLLDIVWLHGCPLFADVRDHETYRAVEASVLSRADRITRILGMSG